MRIHHLAFRTLDLPRLEHFYATVLGLPCIRRSGARSVWLDAGGTLLMLEASSPEEPSIARSTLELVCFELSPETAAAALARLERASIPIEARTECTVYFRDPDGRRVGLSSYPTPLLAIV